MCSGRYPPLRRWHCNTAIVYVINVEEVAARSEGAGGVH